MAPDPAKKSTLELTTTELDILGLLVGLGLSAFDVPGGPAYVLKGRLEKKKRYMITTQDIINVMKKIEEAGKKQ
jgi:hypothetical protein